MTVAGQSAGGLSVHAHVLDAKLRSAKPLFQRAIIQSGAMGTVGPIPMDEADQKWIKLCQHLRIAENSGRDRISFLRDIPASDLIRAASESGYIGFLVVADNRTLTAAADGKWSFFLGPESNVDSQVTNTGPIDVLIGDCDAEVSISSTKVHSMQALTTFCNRTDYCVDCRDDFCLVSHRNPNPSTRSKLSSNGFTSRSLPQTQSSKLTNSHPKVRHETYTKGSYNSYPTHYSVFPSTGRAVLLPLQITTRNNT